MNVKNNFQIIGRLVADPTIYDNKDGSKKVRYTIATRDNYVNRKGERNTQFIPVETFLSADTISKRGVGVFAHAHKGDFVAVTGRIQNNNYTDKDGVLHYGCILQVKTYDFMESKTQTYNRILNRATA